MGEFHSARQNRNRTNPLCRGESLLSLLRMHWDHEPTPNPSQEGNVQDADGCQLHSWKGSGVGRFMELKYGRGKNLRCLGCGADTSN